MKQLVLLSGVFAMPAYAAITPVHASEATGLLLGYVLFCLWTAQRFRRKQRVATRPPKEDAKTQPAVLVTYASQTGHAELVAGQTVQALQAAGVATQMCSLGSLQLVQLRSVERALFIVSTTGEGDAPDDAAQFVRAAMHAAAALPNLHYGVLALGDSSYRHFCRFGHSLDAWLQQSGAQPQFAMIEVDNGDAAALQQWQRQLAKWSGAVLAWQAPQFQPWQLAERQCVNVGSAGAPTYQISLRSTSAAVAWQAGDIAEIVPLNAVADVKAWLVTLRGAAEAAFASTALIETLQQRHLPWDEASQTALCGLADDDLLAVLKPVPPRAYSIASLPEEGSLDLLVRQTQQSDGRLGVGSGWLTEHAPQHGEIALRILANRAFHPPPQGVPLILIGNGTGMAGLRAHLKARVAAGEVRNWLIFGERNAAHDFYYRDELTVWQQNGQLARLDTVFSRDQTERVYVQDALRAASDELLRWINDGAAIYVCGSASGMAPAVDDVLCAVFGEVGVNTLKAAGRYRRDVY